MSAIAEVLCTLVYGGRAGSRSSGRTAFWKKSSILLRDLIAEGALVSNGVR
jgi:hypothetical protein